MMRPILIAILMALLAFPAAAQGVSIMPVKLLDTSGEARDQMDDHERRQVLLAEVIAGEIGDATLIGADAVTACPPQSTECLLSLAQQNGDRFALFIVSQKTSTLILQLFANLVDVRTGDLVISRNLNFRGDTDDAWRRAGRFLGRQLRDAID